MYPSFDQISRCSYATMVRYAHWLGVDTSKTGDCGEGRRKLAMRIARALKRNTWSRPGAATTP